MSRWHAEWSDNGSRGLKKADRAGRPPLLSGKELRRVASALEKGPRSHGYATDLWTLGPRRRGDGGDDWRRLSPWARLEDSAYPARLEPAAAGTAGKERDDEAITTLGEKRLAEDKKGARRRKAFICFEDESGFSLLPSVRATWAPRGKTPVLMHGFNWKRLSMSAALGICTGRLRQAWLFTLCSPAPINDESLISFLEELHEELDGRASSPLIWDGLPSHRSGRDERLDQRAAFLARHRTSSSLWSRPQPGRLVWGNLKSSELREPLSRHDRRCCGHR